MENKSKEYLLKKRNKSLTGKIINFLKKNGFEKTDENIYGNDYIAVTLNQNENELAVVTNSGHADYLPYDYYSLLGYLIDKRIVGFNYFT